MTSRKKTVAGSYLLEARTQGHQCQPAQPRGDSLQHQAPNPESRRTPGPGRLIRTQPRTKQKAAPPTPYEPNTIPGKHSRLKSGKTQVPGRTSPPQVPPPSVPGRKAPCPATVCALAWGPRSSFSAPAALCLATPGPRCPVSRLRTRTPRLRWDRSRCTSSRHRTFSLRASSCRAHVTGGACG